jgi:hypothetical protein
MSWKSDAPRACGPRLAARPEAILIHLNQASALSISIASRTIARTSRDFLDHGPGESQHTPAVQNEEVLRHRSVSKTSAPV